MKLHWVDLAVLIAYLTTMVVVGLVVKRRARLGMSHYFLGANKLPWWALSMSNAASMFDISGTMWLVYLLFAYGLKSVFMPWLWPVFNQVFLMVYLSAWLRRSGALTGGDWITLRFGSDLGAEASRISVVLFALVSVVGFTGYAFVGLSKFAAEFLPAGIPPDSYALMLIAVTTLYTSLGGLYSVVITDLIQFTIMVCCSLALAWLAVTQVAPDQLAAATPAGWDEIAFSWQLDLRWSDLLPAVQDRIDDDGFEMFGAFFLMMVFKGVLVSAAGPAPNYDMQRILAARSPREASLVSGMVSVVLFIPRYLMIAGITVLALVRLGPQVTAGDKLDLEAVLPIVIRDFVPIGLTGLMIAGLIAAFMSTFAGTVNSAAAYLVNDVYRRYWNPGGTERQYIRASYVASLALVVVGCAAGRLTPSVSKATEWIVAALWGGYAAPNVLKWYWWRMNGHGYFWGMTTGLAGAVTLLAFPAVKPLQAFPLLLAISAAGSVAGSLATHRQTPAVLHEFYRRTRPWGLWKPVAQAAIAADPSFVPNRALPRDLFNVAVGIVWQTSLIAMPIYAVIQQWHHAAIALAVTVGATAILKRTWYDRLSEREFQSAEPVLDAIETGAS